MEKTAESQFWDRYIQLARQEDVPEKALRWYVRRVEQYIQAHAYSSVSGLAITQHARMLQCKS